MKKFIVIYTASPAAMEKMKNASPEDMKNNMGPWMEWAQKCGNSLVDLGTPLINGKKMATTGSIPSDKGIVGYSMLQAENMEEAKSLLKDHPHLGWEEGCEIEIYESMPLAI